MRFSQYTIQINKKVIMVLEPLNAPCHLWFAEPIIDSRSMLANAEGFAFMRDLFLIAAQRKEPNIMFYVPRPRLNEETPAMAISEIRSWYKIGEFDMDLALCNFHYLHIGPKEVKKVIQSLRYIPKYTVRIEPDSAVLSSYIDKFEYWQLKNVLHTKAYSKMLIISADSEVLLHLAYQADGFTGIEDDVRHNFHAHSHADRIGTSENNGLNFFYYLSTKND